MNSLGVIQATRDFDAIKMHADHSEYYDSANAAWIRIGCVERLFRAIFSRITSCVESSRERCMRKTFAVLQSSYDYVTANPHLLRVKQELQFQNGQKARAADEPFWVGNLSQDVETTSKKIQDIRDRTFFVETDMKIACARKEEKAQEGDFNDFPQHVQFGQGGSSWMRLNVILENNTSIDVQIGTRAKMGHLHRLLQTNPHYGYGNVTFKLVTQGCIGNASLMIYDLAEQYAKQNPRLPFPVVLPPKPPSLAPAQVKEVEKKAEADEKDRKGAAANPPAPQPAAPNLPPAQAKKADKKAEADLKQKKAAAPAAPLKRELVEIDTRGAWGNVDIITDEKVYRVGIDSLNIKIADLKERMAAITSIEPHLMRLLIGNMSLSDDRKLADYGVVQDSSIHILPKTRGCASIALNLEVDKKAAAAKPKEMPFAVTVKMQQGTSFTISDITPSDTVEQIKRKILARVPKICIKHILYKGMQLEMDKTAKEIFGSNNLELHVIYGSRGGVVAVLNDLRQE